jgi:sulfane dehydrogenase subunit SoxC
MPLEALRYQITPVGLHYLLIHYDIPVVDPATWRLSLGGSVERPLTITLDELKSRPRVTAPVTLECAGNGRALLAPRPISQPWLHEAVGTAEWTGTPLRPLLEEAGVRSDAVEVLFTGLDRGEEGGVEQDYERSLPLAEALRPEVMLAYEANGAPLPPQHGFPLRLVVPGWYGMTHVKWLRSITLLDQPYQGFQNAEAYRLKVDEDDPGTPVTRMAPRSLMAPPGIPEFATRTRLLRPEPCQLEGRAWSGSGSIARVEVSVDGGRKWADAEVEPAPAPFAWHHWTYRWESPEVGNHELCSRATDASGMSQPLEPPWNLKGYANNAVQRVPVVVRS